jgi:hypothetical protein
LFSPLISVSLLNLSWLFPFRFICSLTILNYSTFKWTTHKGQSRRKHLCQSGVGDSAGDEYNRGNPSS